MSTRLRRIVFGLVLARSALGPAFKQGGLSVLPLVLRLSDDAALQAVARNLSVSQIWRLKAQVRITDTY